MSGPNFVAVKCGTLRYKKLISFLIIYTWYDNLARRKMAARYAKYYYKRPSDWLTIFVWLSYDVLRGSKMFIRL